jgi:alpha-beta hydrolase superfamily lysophospholipase
MDTEETQQQTSSLYRVDAPGDWGVMTAPQGGMTGTERLTAPRRPDIFYRYWQVSGPATLLILHGLGAHSGWFIDMGNSLAARGVSVYEMDHQGFGRSGGVRGHVSNWREYLTDIDRMVDVVRHDQPGTHAFILGHSMGGVFAIHYAAAHQDKLAGMILMNPWIADTTTLPVGLTLSILAGGITGSSRPMRLPDTGHTEKMTSNADADRLLKADPYWVTMRTKGFYWQITQMRGQTLARARAITCPVLVVQAERDAAVVPAATRKAFDLIPSTDKTYLTYPTYEHDAEFEADRSALDADLAEWMLRHSAS